jgi:hypothetical protein
MARVLVSYDGNYVRQGWGGGCNPQAGAETGPVFGALYLTVEGGGFTKPQVSFGRVRRVGGISNAFEHDSNLLAIKAVKSAILSAF